MAKLKKRIGDILLENNILGNDDIEKILEMKNRGEKFGQASIRLGFVTEVQLLNVLSEQTGSVRINLAQYPIDEDILKMIPEEYATENEVLAIAIKDKKIILVTSDPLDYFVLEDVRMITGLTVEPVLSTRSEIRNAIKKFYGFSRTLKSLGLENMDEALEEEEEFINASDEADNTPMGKLINQILSTAINERASDIHIDPSETRVAIRYRIDGVLKTEQILPKKLFSQIVSRVKVLARMRIQETRRPQDGRVKKTIENKTIDLRISTLPTIYGEKVVMRLLDTDSSVDGVSGIGLVEEDLSKVRGLLSTPNGIVLVSGPTGSGKSTTLYAGLTELNSEDVNIITVEDPVEMQIEGINQVQVEADIDLTFANALRSILRQDPNIVMIGEIRDKETAGIAVRAALTGHLVMSTIHTNDAVRTITRLTDMGIEPFLVASSLNGVISQRLIRKVCRSCNVEKELTDSEKTLFARYGITGVDKTKKAMGCPVCNGTGYLGRTGIFEILVVNDEIRQMISNNEDFISIKQKIIASGMKPLIESGLEKVKAGITTIEELLKSTIE